MIWLASFHYFFGHKQMYCQNRQAASAMEFYATMPDHNLIYSLFIRTVFKSDVEYCTIGKIL